MRNATYIAVISSAKVAEQLGLSRATVNRLAAKGGLPTLGKFPGRRGPYVFDAAEIDALAAERAAS